MAITFPLSLPSSPYFKRALMNKIINFTRFTSPVNQATQHLFRMGDHWRLEATLPAMTEEDSRAWRAFFDALAGPTGTFTLPHPLFTGPVNGSVGSGVINGASQTGTSIVTDGWTASQTPLFTGGHDIIQIGDRVHAITQDVNSDGSGNATLEVWPPVITAPADNAAIDTASPEHTMRLLQPVNYEPQEGGSVWIFDQIVAREDWET